MSEVADIKKNIEVDIVNIEKDKKEIQKLKDSINLVDFNTISKFGDSTQAKLNSFANQALQNVKNKESGETGDLLAELVGLVKANPIENFIGEKGTISNMFSKVLRAFTTFVAGHEKVLNQMEALAGRLKTQKEILLLENNKLDELYDSNILVMRELESYILAAEEVIKENQGAKNDQEEASVEELSNRSDHAQGIQRLEKRVHDLKLTKMVMLQALPQTRLVQYNNSELADKIQSTIQNTLPLWKNQIVLAISLDKQAKAVHLQKKIGDTTNEMLETNAKMLKNSSIKIAQESQRGIVDIASLRAVNKDLIETLETTLLIQAEGKSKRESAEAELINLENQLKQAMLDIKKD